MAVKWRPVRGYEERYEVSNDGQVRSLRFRNGVVDKPRDIPLVLKPHASCGYLHVTLYNHEGSKYVHIASLMLSAFVGLRPIGMQAGHLDGVKTHNVLSNLKWVTGEENQYHRKLHGTASVGEKHALAKLSNKDVLEIRRRFSERRSYRYGLEAMAKEFGVSVPTIQRVKRGANWRHLAI